MAARGVGVITGKRVTRIEDKVVVCADGFQIPADIVVLAAGAAPPPVVENMTLPKDPRGFLLTHDTLQSTGPANVFAVGDSGTVADAGTPKAGVYAVRQGPVLWNNIAALVRGEPLTPYEPQHDFLRLLNNRRRQGVDGLQGLDRPRPLVLALQGLPRQPFHVAFRVTRS